MGPLSVCLCVSPSLSLSLARARIKFLKLRSGPVIGCGLKRKEGELGLQSLVVSELCKREREIKTHILSLSNSCHPTPRRNSPPRPHKALVFPLHLLICAVVLGPSRTERAAAVSEPENSIVIIILDPRFSITGSVQGQFFFTLVLGLFLLRVVRYL